MSTSNKSRADIKSTTTNHTQLKDKLKQQALQSIKQHRYNAIQQRRNSTTDTHREIIYDELSLDTVIKKQVNDTIIDNDIDYTDLTNEEYLKLMCDIENEIQQELHSNEYSELEQQWLQQCADENIPYNNGNGDIDDSVLNAMLDELDMEEYYEDTIHDKNCIICPCCNRVKMSLSANEEKQTELTCECGLDVITNPVKVPSIDHVRDILANTLTSHSIHCNGKPLFFHSLSDNSSGNILQMQCDKCRTLNQILP